jgi:hypothetical protein
MAFIKMIQVIEILSKLIYLPAKFSGMLQEVLYTIALLSDPIDIPPTLILKGSFKNSHSSFKGKIFKFKEYGNIFQSMPVSVLIFLTIDLILVIFNLFSKHHETDNQENTPIKIKSRTTGRKASLTTRLRIKIKRKSKRVNKFKKDQNQETMIKSSSSLPKTRNVITQELQDKSNHPTNYDNNKKLTKFIRQMQFSFIESNLIDYSFYVFLNLTVFPNFSNHFTFTKIASFIVASYILFRIL